MEVAIAALVILAYTAVLWRVAVKHEWWDRRDIDVAAALIGVPDLVDYTVYPDDVGGLT